MPSPRATRLRIVSPSSDRNTMFSSPASRRVISSATAVPRHVREAMSGSDPIAASESEPCFAYGASARIRATKGSRRKSDDYDEAARQRRRWIFRRSDDPRSTARRDLGHGLQARHLTGDPAEEEPTMAMVMGQVGRSDVGDVTGSTSPFPAIAPGSRSTSNGRGSVPPNASRSPSCRASPSARWSRQGSYVTRLQRAFSRRVATRRKPDSRCGRASEPPL